jgi:hypothetical protein
MTHLHSIPRVDSVFLLVTSAPGFASGTVPPFVYEDRLNIDAASFLHGRNEALLASEFSGQTIPLVKKDNTAHNSIVL